jgi:crotonobetainyl-CoA:carnitine CoA-transferase CaiB-like acyl-CoA transferase
MEETADSLLGGIRVLDLADEKGLLCGKLLGELGADVIKIEPPGGDPARTTGPFHKDVPHPERSLFWFFTNMYKRGITLDIAAPDGRDVFRRLVETADIVVESFDPGHMEALGLGYPELERINPGIIMTSITPFGRTGPYARYKATDLVGVSMGGMVYISGEMDRAPNRISSPQFYFMGSLHAASGTMVALYHRELTGEGQHVDVSCQQAVVLSLMVVPEIWDMLKFSYRGMGPHYAGARPGAPPLFSRVIYPCKDGHVFALITGAAQSGMIASSKALAEMAGREGMAQELRDYPWHTIDAATITQEELDAIIEPIRAFIATKTKAELFDEALERGILLAPITTMQDVAESPQLAARGFWQEIEHPELRETIKYPGYPIKTSEPVRPRARRAPLVGEHNQEVYESELGYSKGQLALLRNRGII